MSFLRFKCNETIMFRVFWNKSLLQVLSYLNLDYIGYYIFCLHFLKLYYLHWSVHMGLRPVFEHSMSEVSTVGSVGTRTLDNLALRSPTPKSLSHHAPALTPCMYLKNGNYI